MKRIFDHGGPLPIFLLALTLSGCASTNWCSDADRDGVGDSVDRCPVSPRILYGPVDETGCPVDKDNDGVLNAQDQCPDSPVGFAVDAVGCPLDTDQDGVADYLDQCPDTPTDRSIPVSARGCPIDNDYDGVPDVLDQCPATPMLATTNAAGCWIIHTVHFAFDKADLTAKEQKELDKLADILSVNPHVRLAVHGHADSRGTAKYNQQLSMKRAQAIRAYVTARGIGVERLATFGFGATKPVAPNNTEQGRARNRRGEFKPAQPRAGQ